MYIALRQCYERCFVFSQLPPFKQSQFTLTSSFAILRNGRSSYRRSSRFRPPKSCKEVVTLFERSKPQSTQKKITGLSMIFEIGKLRARKKFHYTSWGLCLKIMMFTVCKLFKRGSRPWQPFLKRPGICWSRGPPFTKRFRTTPTLLTVLKIVLIASSETLTLFHFAS